MKKLTYKTSKGVEKEVPQYGTPEYSLYTYELMKINNKGHNYEYWNEEKHGKMLKNGYELYKFTNSFNKVEFYSYSEINAKEIVNKLREEGNYARIVCGYSQNVQRMKTFSILYKKKKYKVEIKYCKGSEFVGNPCLYGKKENTCSKDCEVKKIKIK